MDIDRLFLQLRDLSPEEQREAMAKLMADAPLEARKAGVSKAFEESWFEDEAVNELISAAMRATADQQVGEALKKAPSLRRRVDGFLAYYTLSKSPLRRKHNAKIVLSAYARVSTVGFTTGGL